MITIEEALDTRTTSSFPISIGTALALETMFDGVSSPYDTERKIPNRVDVNVYRLHYYNIRTLVRNIIGAVSIKELVNLNTTPPKRDILVNEISKTLQEELEFITGVYSNTDCGILFYYPTYEKFTKIKNKNILFRDIENSDKYMENLFYEELAEHMSKVYGKIEIIDYKLPVIAKGGRALITTHITVDLLNKINLDLLESHTGVLKHKNMFNSKYYPVGKNPLDRLPFKEKLLYIMGDKNFIRPNSISIRREIIDIANEHRWLPTTTEDKIKSNFKKNDGLYKLYMEMNEIY